MKNFDFPYEIKDVARILSLQLNHENEYSGYYTCPFCNSKGKLNLNYNTDQFRCNKCGENGGMLALYSKLEHCDTKEANKRIREHMNIGSIAKNSYNSSKKKNNVKTAFRASREQINAVFRDFCNMLTLSPTHREKLLERGYTNEQIDFCMYKSTPIFGLTHYPELLMKKGHSLKGVPGFFVNNDGQWQVNFQPHRSGILIPMIDIDDMLSGFQIRLDVPITNKKKYLWLTSTNENEGTSAGSPVAHFGSKNPDILYLTEGPIKAALAHFKTGMSFTGFAGINNKECLRHTLSVCKNNGTKMVLDFCDMDSVVNPQVEKGRQALAKMVTEDYGLEVKRASWNPKYKGIDDLLVACPDTDIKTLY